VRRPVALLITGQRGDAISTLSSAAVRRSAAGAIRGLWNAPATASRVARRLASPATCSARSQAVALPEITTCPGALKFAGTSTRSLSGASAILPSTFSHRSVAEASSAPIRATMPEGDASAASCIACPRSATSLSPSSNESAPARCSAVYSPRLSPAAAAIGRVGRVVPRDGADAVPRGDGGHEDRGLGRVGLVQALRGSLEAQGAERGPQGVPEERIGPVEDRAGLGVG
jgi:hypothetical protein